ncbi:MAG: caspase family protein [Deltaproteobacteria bacterium]|nr:caspase family protein [Deltaproteobacteria bacterium]
MLEIWKETTGGRELIIGISDYKDSRIPDLETPLKDAQIMARLLKIKCGFTGKTLLNRRTTKKVFLKFKNCCDIVG